MGWKAAALDSMEQSGTTSSPKPPKSGWSRDLSEGHCHPKSPTGEGSSPPRTLSCLSLLLTLLYPWIKGHKGSACHSCLLNPGSPTGYQPPELPED